MTPAGCDVRVLAGTLNLQAIKLPFLTGKAVTAIQVDETTIAFTPSDAGFTFNQPVHIGAGQGLQVVGITG